MTEFNDNSKRKDSYLTLASEADSSLTLTEDKGKEIAPLDVLPSKEAILRMKEDKGNSAQHNPKKLSKYGESIRAADEITKDEVFETEEQRIERIRAISRRSYLKDRSEKKLFLRKKELEDEERLLFRSGVHLTKQEREEHEKKRRELSILISKMEEEERLSSQEVYRMPDTLRSLKDKTSMLKMYEKGQTTQAARIRAANERDLRKLGVDRRFDKGELTTFEEIQMKRSVAKYGAQDVQDVESVIEKELLGQVEFVEEEALEKQLYVMRFVRKKMEKAEHSQSKMQIENNKDTMKQQFEHEALLKWEAKQNKRKSEKIARSGEEHKHDSSKDHGFVELMDEEEKLKRLQSGDTSYLGTSKHSSSSSVPSTEQTQAQSFEKLQETRRGLPVYQYRSQFLSMLKENQVIVVVAQTGSGKTTQLPQYCHEAGYTKDGKKVGITQPRRVAAMSVATRVAEEMGVVLGAEVGYSIRFEEKTSDQTIVKYMTDGMLLREFLSDPGLETYSVMMLDEAHERTLDTDILFGLLKDVCRLRKTDFHLIISSATLNADKFSKFFDGAPILEVPGRMFPVDVMYVKQPELDYADAAVSTALQIHLTQPLGDVLIFLTGQEEIEFAVEEITRRAKQLQFGFEDGTASVKSRIKELIVVPIYSTMPSEQQAKIFEPTPPNARKIIVATNIAETSLTIDGVVYVVDCGFCKLKTFNPKTGVESLVVHPISRSNAMQRTGRAGRVRPGKCYRLYTKYAFEAQLTEENPPEIQRSDLSQIVLLLMSLGIDNLVDFDYLDPPPVECLRHALQHLYALGALNSKGELTKLGRRMGDFPLSPPLSRALIAGEERKVTNEVITIAAMLDVENAVFWRPRFERKKQEGDEESSDTPSTSTAPSYTAFTARTAAFSHPAGDHLSLLRVYSEWEESGFSSLFAAENFLQQRSLNRAREIREQLVNLCHKLGIEMWTNPDNDEEIRKALLSGFFANVAKNTGMKHGGKEKAAKAGEEIAPKSLEDASRKKKPKPAGADCQFTTVKHPHTVYLHPTSFLFKTPPQWVMFHQSVMTKREYMRQATEIKQEWLNEVAPHYFASTEVGKKIPQGKMGRMRSGVDERRRWGEDDDEDDIERLRK